MDYNYDTNNVACHWISCEICNNEVVLVNGNGKYYSLKAHEISLVDGKFKVENVLRKLLCRNCLDKLTVADESQDIVVNSDWLHKT